MSRARCAMSAQWRGQFCRLATAEASRDVHWTFLGQVERGRRNLSLNNLVKIAAGLDVAPAELARGLKAPKQ